jgi:hypothetical protein
MELATAVSIVNKYPDVRDAIQKGMHGDKGLWSHHYTYTAHAVFYDVRDAIESDNEYRQYDADMAAVVREDGAVVVSYGTVLPEHIEVQYSMTGLQHSGYCSDASSCPRMVKPIGYRTCAVLLPVFAHDDPDAFAVDDPSKWDDLYGLAPMNFHESFCPACKGEITFTVTHVARKPGMPLTDKPVYYCDTSKPLVVPEWSATEAKIVCQNVYRTHCYT